MLKQLLQLQCATQHVPDSSNVAGSIKMINKPFRYLDCLYKGIKKEK
ncbi:hypothetical protein BH10BAC2_BH10BAC2_37700 [soil metagenome]